MEVTASRTEEYSIEVAQSASNRCRITVMVVKGSGGGGAAQVQTDWNETDPESLAFINNKPTIPAALSDLSEDTTHRTVTDTEKSTWSGKADGNHNHDGVYDPAGTAAGAVSSHQSAYDHDQLALVPVLAGSLDSLAQQVSGLETSKEDTGTAAGLVSAHESAYFHTTANQVWNSVINVNRDSDTYINCQAATVAGAALMAAAIVGQLARWTNADGSIVKRGFVMYATSTQKVVYMTMRGDPFVATDTNFRLSLYEKVRMVQYFVPGELFADGSTDIGYEFMLPSNHTLRGLCCDAYLKTAAAGAGADLQYDLFDNGTGIMTTDPTFGSGSSVLNSQISNSQIFGGRRLSLRITVSAGATNLAQGLSVLFFWAYDDLYNAI